MTHQAYHRRSRTALPDADRSATILKAALQLATTGGLRAVTPERVAAAAGLSRITIVKYHPGGAAGLRTAVMREAVAGEVLPVVAEGLVTRCPVAATAGDRLKAACKVWIIEQLN